MTKFNARNELARAHNKFATQFGKYELRFEPHLLGSMISVSSRDEDEFCGTYLTSDAPTGFIVALASAARTLRNLDRKRRVV